MLNSHRMPKRTSEPALRPRPQWVSQPELLVGGALFVTAGGLLVASLLVPLVEVSFDPPFLYKLPVAWRGSVRAWFLELAGISVGEARTGQIVKSLWTQGDELLAFVIVAFAIFFPWFKLFVSMSLLVGAERFSRGTRRLLDRLLGFASRWSMGDVFVVAFLVAMFRAQKLRFAVEARGGLYLLFGGAIAAGILAELVHHAERRSLCSELKQVRRDLAPGASDGGDPSIALSAVIERL